MSKTSFQNIKELVAELGVQIEALDKGNLSLDELESLVSNGKDVYERLVVIRHKAYEQVSSESELEEAEPAKEEVEVVEEKVDEPEVEQEDNSQPAFDFSVDLESVEETKEEEIGEEVEEVVEEIIEEEEVEEVVEEVVEEEEETVEEGVVDQTVENDNKSSLTLNDIHGDGEQSLRKKLQNTPIEDINSEISLARKFELISCMFDGQDEEYEKAVGVLNNCSNAEEAREKMGEYSSNFKWDLENKAIIKFVELVERRYL